MTDKTGGPAFPIVEYKQPVGGGAHMMTIIGGMTLRDYFAAKAMEGMLSNGDVGYEEISKTAYKYADAMMKERKQ